jgi:hypothetical protein
MGPICYRKETNQRTIRMPIISSGGQRNINTESKIEWLENEHGLLVQTETKLEKKQKMTRPQWKEWFNSEEITEEEYKQEQMTYMRALNGHMG